MAAERVAVEWAAEEREAAREAAVMAAEEREVAEPVEAATEVEEMEGVVWAEEA